MKWTAPIAAIAMAVVTVATVAPPVASARTAAAAARRDFPAVQAFADAAVRDGKVPGIAIAIGQADSAPIWIVSGRIAFEPGAPRATPDTLWRIYSMTKPITGIAAMMLVDEGKLRLDQPVSDIVPEFANAQVLLDPTKSLATRPAKSVMTIRDLMTHGSGLNYAIQINTPARQALREAGLLPLQVNPHIEAEMRRLRPATLNEFARRAGRSPLIADPGTQWNYSMGLDVLAAVVERVSGQRFETFVQRRLLTPLGMTSSGWQVSPARVGRLASSYGPKGPIEATWPGPYTAVRDDLLLVDAGRTSAFRGAPSFAYGGAGLVSSARDYDRFLHMLLNGGTLGGTRILSPATARLAMSNLLPPGVFLQGFGPVPPGEKTGFGAGGFVTLRTVDGFGRSAGTFGWDGAAGTRAWVDPVRKLRATMMINVIAEGTLGSGFDKAIALDMAQSGAPLHAGRNASR